MILADYAETCPECREALQVRLFHRYHMACMGCRGRNLARNPVTAAARNQARVWKDTLPPSDFDAAMNARAQWIEHDQEARRAA